MARTKVQRGGGQHVAFPNKEPRSVNAQLTTEGHKILSRVKRAQRGLNFKHTDRDPSTGDIFEGLLRQFGTDLVLPEPSRAS